MLCGNVSNIGSGRAIDCMAAAVYRQQSAACMTEAVELAAAADAGIPAIAHSSDTANHSHIIASNESTTQSNPVVSAS